MQTRHEAAVQTRRDFLSEAEAVVIARGNDFSLGVGRPCRRDATFVKDRGVCSGQRNKLFLRSGAAARTRRDFLFETEVDVVTEQTDLF